MPALCARCEGRAVVQDRIKEDPTVTVGALPDPPKARVGTARNEVEPVLDCGKSFRAVASIRTWQVVSGVFACVWLDEAAHNDGVADRDHNRLCRRSLSDERGRRTGAS